MCKIFLVSHARLMHTDMHMRPTIILDSTLVDRAKELTGIDEKTALVRAGLEALVARESARRLAALGGTDPDAMDVPRRRAAPEQ